MKRILIFIAIFVCYIAFFCLIYFCVSNESPAERILKNENVLEGKLLESKLVGVFNEYEIEIYTKDCYRILLHGVRWSLKNKGIEILKINDIGYFGGRIYENTNNKRICFSADDISGLGKILGIKLNSVDDVINNIDKLYELFKLLVANSRNEFIYKDKFIINADFRYLQDSSYLPGD